MMTESSMNFMSHSRTTARFEGFKGYKIRGSNNLYDLTDSGPNRTVDISEYASVGKFQKGPSDFL